MTNKNPRCEDHRKSSLGSHKSTVNRARDFRSKIEQKLDAQEKHARNYAELRPLLLFFLDGYASFKVLFKYLISLDAVLGASLSVALTVFLYDLNYDKYNTDEYHGANLNFFLLGFAILMPLSVTIRITFVRREEALRNIASIKALSLNIYLSHATWDWGLAPGGRSEQTKNWVEHSDKVIRLLVSFGDELTRFLTMPNASYARHRETVPGRKEAAVTMGASTALFEDVLTDKITDLTLMCEQMKLEGFSASESSRLRQWEQFLVLAAENLRTIKMYRSPQALWALLQVTTVFLPPFYAPAFAQLAFELNSLGFAIAFAVLTSLTLTALYESVRILEDPFVACLTIDGIDVYEELSVLCYRELVRAREKLFPNAPDFDDDEFDESEERTSFGESDVSKEKDTVIRFSIGRRMSEIRGLLNKPEKDAIETRAAKMQSFRGQKKARTSIYMLDLPDDLDLDDATSGNMGNPSNGTSSRGLNLRSSHF